MYSKRLYAGWGDMDFNAHMSNTAYLNKCGDVRMMLFAENGFPISELAQLTIGLVAMREGDRNEGFHFKLPRRRAHGYCRHDLGHRDGDQPGSFYHASPYAPESAGLRVS